MCRQGAASHAALVPPTVNERHQLQRRITTHVQRTDPLGAVTLVRTDRHQVNRQLTQVDLNLADTLRRIDMKPYATLTAHLPDGSNIIDCADLVVGMHHRDDKGIRTDRLGNLPGSHLTVFVRRQAGHLMPLTFQPGTGIQDGLVFNGGGHDVAGLSASPGQPLERQIVRLRCPRGPDNFSGIRFQQIRHLTPGTLHGFFSPPPQHV